MGEHLVHDTSDDQRTRTFVRAMLDDIRALERMIEQGMIESDLRRIGVEQEMYIVDAQDYPAPLSDRVLEKIGDPRFSTELARFNLEANLDPSPVGGDFLRAMENGLKQVLSQAEHAANELGARIVLTGILPTLQHEHVTLAALTPEVRYQCLNDTCMSVRGERFTLVIDGLDHFESSHDCAVVEGASTSFQFHLQVSPEAAVPLYNLAQLITAPLLAVAANSPVLFDRRVWHETRVALFERAFEYRSTPQLARDFPTRVGFGETWVKDSILEIFRENAMRHNVIMVRDDIADPFALLEDGKIPDLGALALHNGTVWRWNRPCYGITDGKPHLRIENRALPAGPTIVDQVANVALYYGLMQAMESDAGRIPERIVFENARLNFFAAAQHGLAARFTWLDGRRIGAAELLRRELIPAARAGLAALRVPAEDNDYYLGIIADRVDCGRTGARWLLDSLANVAEPLRAATCRQAVQCVHQRQAGSTPVHCWDLVAPDADFAGTRDIKKVGDIMTTNLFTVRPEDLLDLATSMMEWRHMRHVPVETASGELVGLLSTRELLQLRSGDLAKSEQPIPVAEIMLTDPVTVTPDITLHEACKKMLENDAGCLLVVARGQLLGIVTERDLLQAAMELIPDNRE